LVVNACSVSGLNATLSHRCIQVEIIEHRLFSEISKEWADRPLDRYS
jgi:hypothetical protein